MPDSLLSKGKWWLLLDSSGRGWGVAFVVIRPCKEVTRRETHSRHLAPGSQACTEEQASLFPVTYTLIPVSCFHAEMILNLRSQDGQRPHSKVLCLFCLLQEP